MEKRLFTSECVTCGHPDKVADAISDAILDACLAEDPGSRVACETMVTTNFCLICGEITTKAQVDYEGVAREVIARSAMFTLVTALMPIPWRSSAASTPSLLTLHWAPTTRSAAQATRA